MKHAYAALVAVVLTSVSLAALAQKQASVGKVFLLKAGGETIAELRVRQDANVAVVAAGSSSHLDYNTSAGVLDAKGGAILKLTAGTNSISVQADEIQSVPDSK